MLLTAIIILINMLCARAMAVDDGTVIEVETLDFEATLAAMQSIPLDDLDLYMYEEASKSGQAHRFVMKTSSNGLAKLKAVLENESPESSRFLTSHPTNISHYIEHERQNIQACHARVALYREERNFMNASESLWVNDDFFDCFWKTQDILDYLTRLEDHARPYLSRFRISSTVQNQTIPAFHLSSSSGTHDTTTTSKSKIYIQGMLHAREWISPPTVIYMMTYLVDVLVRPDLFSDAVRSRVQTLLDQVDFIFVPVINLDGYDTTWTLDRMWRKNRRPHSKDENTFQSFGVDLNRNYGPVSKFCGSGASSRPTSQVYCGPQAYSEPEIAGIHDYMEKHGEILGSIDVHCYAASVYVTAQAEREVVLLAKGMASAINLVHAQDYHYDHRRTTTYGTFKDYQVRQLALDSTSRIGLTVQCFL